MFKSECAGGKNASDDDDGDGDAILWLFPKRPPRSRSSDSPAASHFR